MGTGYLAPRYAKFFEAHGVRIRLCFLAQIDDVRDPRVAKPRIFSSRDRATEVDHSFTRSMRLVAARIAARCGSFAADGGGDTSFVIFSMYSFALSTIPLLI